MITERDLNEAIAECEGERNPKAATCIKLAAFYTLKEHLFPEGVMYNMPTASYASGENNTENIIDYDSGSEFSNIINGRKASEIWPLMDELMDALTAINPRLYNSVMRKIK